MKSACDRSPDQDLAPILSSSEGFPQMASHIPPQQNRKRSLFKLGFWYLCRASSVYSIILVMDSVIYIQHQTLSCWTSCRLTMIIEDAPIKITLLYTIYIQWQSDLVTVSTFIPFNSSLSFSSCKVWCYSLMTYSLILYPGYIQIPKNTMDKRFQK